MLDCNKRLSKGKDNAILWLLSQAKLFHHPHLVIEEILFIDFTILPVGYCAKLDLKFLIGWWYRFSSRTYQWTSMSTCE